MIEKPITQEHRKVYEPPKAVDLSAYSVNGELGINDATCVNGTDAAPNCNVGLSAGAKCHVGGTAASCSPGSTLTATNWVP